jgi:hypothetical protein
VGKERVRFTPRQEVGLFAPSPQAIRPVAHRSTATAAVTVWHAPAEPIAELDDGIPCTRRAVIGTGECPVAAWNAAPVPAPGTPRSGRTSRAEAPLTTRGSRQSHDQIGSSRAPLPCRTSRRCTTGSLGGRWPPKRGVDHGVDALLERSGARFFGFPDIDVAQPAIGLAHTQVERGVGEVMRRHRYARPVAAHASRNVGQPTPTISQPSWPARRFVGS